MNRSGKYMTAVFAICLVALLAPKDALADGAVTIEVGHSWSKSFGRTPFESKPTITVANPGIASVSWSGGESGTLTITGEEEGETVVTVTGKVRVVGFGAGGGLTVKDVTGKISVTVTAKGEYARVVVLHVSQKMTIKFPKDMKMGPKAPSNSNPPIVRVRRNSSKQLTLTGRKKGDSMLRFKLFIKQKKGKDKEAPGSIWVIVRACKPPKNKTHVTMGWGDLPTGIITLDGQVSLWVPSGDNYGDVGDAAFVNYSEEDQTCGVEDGSWVRSNDDQYQDIVLTDVPTYPEDEPSGASSLDEEFSLPTETVVVVKDVPGGCTVLAKPAPPAGNVDQCTLEPPDEESEALVSVADEVSQIDFTKKPLTSISPEQAKATACQAAFWKVGSQIDSVEGNEVTNEDLENHFFSTYLSATADTREKMTPEKRDEMDKIVRDDLRTVVESIDFVTKKHEGKPAVSGPPAGLEWLASPPPPGAGAVVIRNGDSTVGVVLPADIQQGDQISGTMIVTPLNAEQPEGQILRDPSGQAHPVQTGRAVTFTANDPTMTWTLTDAEGQVLGTETVPVSTAPASPPAGPALVQSNCATDLPGSFDGNLSNTAVSIADRPAVVLAESPRQAIVVPGDLGQTTGNVAIEVTDAGQTFTHNTRAVNTSVDSPQIEQGQWGAANVIVRGLDTDQTQGPIGVAVTNSTPTAVKLKNGRNRQHFQVDPKEIRDDGTYHLEVPVFAVGTGVYVLAASTSSGLLQQSQCATLNCSPCGDIWFCDDKGKVSCGGTRTCSCGGGAGHRRVGGPCGFWLCACPFGTCKC